MTCRAQRGQSSTPRGAALAANHGEAQGLGFVGRRGLGTIIEHDVELDRGTQLAGAALMMPKLDEALPALAASSLTPRCTT
jgi:hypothetical protein